MKTITTDSQPFTAFAFVVGVRLAGVRADARGFCTFDLDDSKGEATKALERWENNDVMVNAKRYNRAYGQVILAAQACRTITKRSKGATE